MKISAVLFVLLNVTNAFSQTDEERIHQVITQAYIQGIHNSGNADEIRKGFHPSFTMLRLVDDNVKPYPIAEWIDAIALKKKENPQTPPKTDGKFISIDITGTAAIVKLELFREEKKIFTDYLVLYKFTEGWKIVSKTFYRHP